MLKGFHLEDTIPRAWEKQDRMTTAKEQIPASKENPGKARQKLFKCQEVTFDLDR